MKLKDITPPEFLCSLSMACPTIFKTDRDTYIIIGKVVSHPDLDGRVGAGETTVEIPCDLVLKALGTNHLEEPR